MTTVAELLADLINPRSTLAKVANLAKNRTSISSPADSTVANRWRIVANPGERAGGGVANSPTFATDSPTPNRPESEHSCGVSPDSPLSPAFQPDSASAADANPGDREAHPHPCRLTAADGPRRPAPAAPDRPYRLAPAEADLAHAESWSEAACARFAARMSMLMRRGFNGADAHDLAERMHLLDVQGEGRALCLGCRHLAGTIASGWRCGNHRVAGIGRDLPRELVTLPQRCPGFKRGNP